MAWWKFWERDGGDRGATPDFYEEGVALMRQELYHDALTSFRLALKADPDDPATYEQMAVAYTHMGLHGDAIRAYTRALELRPDSPSAHYGLAFLLLRSGEEDGAARHLQAFLTHARPDRDDPRHLDHARRTLQRLGASTPEPATP